MVEWLRLWLTDPAFFRRSLKSGLATVGLLMQQGIIPTGIDYGGKYGTALVALAFLFGDGGSRERPRRLHGDGSDDLEDRAGERRMPDADPAPVGRRRFGPRRLRRP